MGATKSCQGFGKANENILGTNWLLTYARVVGGTQLGLMVC